jgi:hypothetical protein
MIGSAPRPKTNSLPWIVTLVVAAAVAVTVATLAVSFPTQTVPTRGLGPPPPLPAQLVDETPALGPVFHPGVILAAASNATTTLLGGIGVYSQPTGYSLPVFAAVRTGPSGLVVENETAEVQSYFLDGGVYAIGWNGSAWLIGGQRSPGNVDDGALIALHNGTITNLTGMVATYFQGGGIWSVGWNGTTWLIGGNSSVEATLLAWNGGAVTDLSSEVIDHGSEPWVQMLRWSGAEWLVGGHGVFGLWTASGYVDLFPASPYQNGGVYSADWNGTAWLVGGDGRELVAVHGEGLTVATTLPPEFDRLALMIVASADGWFIAGKGLGAEGLFAPELSFWNGAPAVSPTDYSGSLPPSFQDGDIQGGVLAPEIGPRAVLMVGVGAYDPSTGYGVGAVALLEPADG